MTRDEAIQTIEALYPPDSGYEDIAALGQELLERARREVKGWRSEPAEVLVRLAEMCIETEAGA